jgi:hypothetical protein
MTTKEDKFTIASTLDEDPEINFFTWKLNIEDVAAGAATLIEPTDLLTVVMTDEEWAEYPANTVVVAATANAPATTALTARPTEPTYKPITAGMTGPTIAINRYANERHETWHTAKEQLKAAIIRSLGATLSTTIGPPPNGFKMMTIRTILEQVALKYATIDWTSLNKMEDIMVTPLDNVMLLDAHLTRMIRHINMSVVAGFNVEEYQRVKIFRQSVQHHHQIAKTLESYDKDQLNPQDTHVRSNNATREDPTTTNPLSSGSYCNGQSLNGGSGQKQPHGGRYAHEPC